MPQKAVSMRQIKEVLRLHDLGLLQSEIARSCSISQSSVNRYLERASAAGRLSVSLQALSTPGDSLSRGGGSVLETLGFQSEYP